MKKWMMLIKMKLKRMNLKMKMKKISMMILDLKIQDVDWMWLSASWMKWMDQKQNLQMSAFFDVLRRNYHSISLPCVCHGYFYLDLLS